MKLEAAIHKFTGNEEKTIQWVTRFQDNTSIVGKVLIGEFLYFTGSGIEILSSTKNCSNLED